MPRKHKLFLFYNYSWFGSGSLSWSDHLQKGKESPVDQVQAPPLREGTSESRFETNKAGNETIAEGRKPCDVPQVRRPKPQATPRLSGRGRVRPIPGS